MRTRNIIQNTLVCLVFLSLCACEEFVAVDVPNDRITSVSVFADDITARRAMDGVYSQMFNTNFAAGGNRSVTFLAGLSADLLDLTGTAGEMEQFAEYTLDPTNGYNRDLWAGAYNTIYMCNSILEGLLTTDKLNADIETSLEGEAKFIRAFSYFYLTQLYGDVPLILSTDYRENAVAPRTDTLDVNRQIIEDLEQAVVLLGEEYPDGERTRANRYTAMALRARVYLYAEDWEQAAYWSGEVLKATGTYSLAEDPNAVFLANSNEAIWQISPAGWGNGFTHTREGNLFIRISTSGSPVTLSQHLMELWETGDLRRDAWVGSYSDGSDVYYYPNKYKVRFDYSGGNFTEYSMVMRLAEQHLIRAEARAYSNDMDGALADIDELRKRANLPLLQDMDMVWTRDQILKSIALERQREFFAEWGHRWLDLKRTDSANELLNQDNAFWESTDTLYPIPADERMKNPNLTQNDGY